MARDERWRELDRLAARAWSAAESIDAIRNGDKAWRWTYKQVAQLTEEGRQNDPESIRPVVEALEKRLAMERNRQQRCGGEVGS